MNIARAIYYYADIIALDDPLSALDAGVGKALFFNAIVGALAGKDPNPRHPCAALPASRRQYLYMEDGPDRRVRILQRAQGVQRCFLATDPRLRCREEHEEEIEGEQMAISRLSTPGSSTGPTWSPWATAHSLMQAEERNSGAMKRARTSATSRPVRASS